MKTKWIDKAKKAKKAKKALQAMKACRVRVLVMRPKLLRTWPPPTLGWYLYEVAGPRNVCCAISVPRPL